MASEEVRSLPEQMKRELLVGGSRMYADWRLDHGRHAPYGLWWRRFRTEGRLAKLEHDAQTADTTRGGCAVGRSETIVPDAAGRCATGDERRVAHWGSGLS